LVGFAMTISLIGGACRAGARPSVPPLAATQAAPPATAASATPLAELVVGGDRPVTVHLPASYDASRPAPLVILLHGYSGNGRGVDEFLHMAPATEARGYVLVYPDGTINRDGNRFWNATDACCDDYRVGVDDVAYLTGLITEIRATVAIDPKRIAFVGHSNGGFMAYRMACEQAGLVAAIVSVAGSTFADEADCAPSEPVSVAQVHGTADGVIRYEGGALSGIPYPGARMTAETWAAYNGCGEQSMPLGAKVDVDSTLSNGGDPAETSTEEWSECRSGASVQLWTVPMGGHVPVISSSFGVAVMDFLDNHPKP
jgi:polyhydroxybutyrate depolymerase